MYFYCFVRASPSKQTTMPLVAGGRNNLQPGIFTILKWINKENKEQSREITKERNNWIGVKYSQKPKLFQVCSQESVSAHDSSWYNVVLDSSEVWIALDSFGSVYQGCSRGRDLRDQDRDKGGWDRGQLN